MVKNEWEFMGFTYIVWGFWALIWGAFFLISLIGENKGGMLFNSGVFLTLAIYTFVQTHRWKPINERRQLAAAWGFAAHVPLAQPHPLPNVAALPLPFTITLRPNWPKFLIALGVLVGTFVISDASAYQNHGLHIINLDDPLELIFFLFPVLAVVLFSVLWLRPQRIEVFQEGLIVRHATGWLHGTTWIRWNDARLFVIRGGKPGMPATRYELSCSYAVVQWTRTRCRRWSLHRPAIPFAEYDAQMDALIALISGVTGLPLYDVR